MKIYKNIMIAILCTIISISSVQAKNYRNHKMLKKSIFSDANIIAVKIKSESPFELNEQRTQAYKILKPYLKKNVLKASVIWQKDEYSYGKIASVSNIYITDFLNRKITGKKFISHFSLQIIEPVPVNKKSYLKITGISDAQIKKALSLREKADIYRQNQKYDSAIRIYNDVLEINPYDTIALFWIADIYRQKNDKTTAKAYLEKLLDIDPDFKAASDALDNLRKTSTQPH